MKHPAACPIASDARVVRRIDSIAFGLFASPGYLPRHGRLNVNGGCPGRFLIAQLEDVQDATQTGRLTDSAPYARVAMQISSH